MAMESARVIARGPGRWLAVALLAACGDAGDASDRAAGATQQPVEAPRSEGPWVAVSLDSAPSSREEHDLEGLAREHEVRLEVQTHPSFAAQMQAVDDWTRERPDRLLVQALVPNGLQRALVMAREAGVPVVALDRGANSEVPFVGVSSRHRAHELGERGADQVRQAGAGADATWRIAVVEDAVWAESHERTEAILSGVRARHEAVEVLPAFKVRGVQQDKVAEVARSLRTMGPVHLIVAGGSDETRVALAAREGAFPEAAIPVIGVSCHDDLVQEVLDDPAPCVLLAYRPLDLIRAALSLELPAAGPPARVEVPSWLVGVEDPP